MAVVLLAYCIMPTEGGALFFFQDCAGFLRKIGVHDLLSTGSLQFRIIAKEYLKLLQTR